MNFHTFLSRSCRLASQSQCGRVLKKYWGSNAARQLHEIKALPQKDMKKIVLADRLDGSGGSGWTELGQLAVENKAVNLSQGFPDSSPPEHFLEAFRDILNENNPLLHQYARGPGHPRLVSALAKLYAPLLNRNLNPMANVITSLGAFHCLYLSIAGLMNPGDECVIIEPYFYCYTSMVESVGGVPRHVQLRPTTSGRCISSADWKLDPVELERAFSDKTKLLIFNSPHNPTGKVFDRTEMTLVADLCKKYDVVCIADDVYEWYCYDGNEHIRMATLPDMWNRTLTIGSAGKTFSATGWRTGWTIGPENLIRILSVMSMTSTYSCPTLEQEALARGLEVELERFGCPDSYFHTMVAKNQRKRDMLATSLLQSNFNITLPQSGFFILANYKHLLNLVDTEEDRFEPDHYRLVKWLMKVKKLAVVPPNLFYSNKILYDDYIRLCFLKNEETLDKAGDIIRNLKVAGNAGESN